MIFQVFNKKINAWVRMRKYASGKTKITNVKQKEPTKPFKGVKKK